MLATGGQDTDIVLWDTISEAGLFRCDLPYSSHLQRCGNSRVVGGGCRWGRLRGHKDVVTDLKFTRDGKRVLSSSKDSLIKFWDLGTSALPDTLTHTEGGNKSSDGRSVLRDGSGGWGLWCRYAALRADVDGGAIGDLVVRYECR